MVAKTLHRAGKPRGTEILMSNGRKRVFFYEKEQGLRHVFGIGETLTEDSRGEPRIFLSRARDEANKPLTPKNSFLLLFRPLYFGNV